MRGFGTPNSANSRRFGTQILKKPQVRKLRVRTFGYQTPGFWKRTGTKPRQTWRRKIQTQKFCLDFHAKRYQISVFGSGGYGRIPNFYFWLRLAVFGWFMAAPPFFSELAESFRSKSGPRKATALDGAPCTREGDAGRVRKVGRGPAPLLREAAYLLATARPTT